MMGWQVDVPECTGREDHVKDLDLCPQSTSCPSKDPSRIGVGGRATRLYMQTGH